MNFEVTVDDPRQIRQISDSLIDIARDNNLANLYVGLDHEHTSIVRGRSEDFRDLNQFEFGLPYPVEVQRTDGGNSWIHSPESRCYERVERIDKSDSKSLEAFMNRWGQEAVTEINDFLDNNYDITPLYQEGDIYDENTGKQLAGLSAEVKEDYILKRMCFYDGEDHGQKFHRLINADMDLAADKGLNLNNPRENVIPLPGLYDRLVAESVNASVDYGELQTGEPPENAVQAKYCVSQMP